MEEYGKGDRPEKGRLTAEQIAETIGDIRMSPEQARIRGLSSDEVEAARQGLQQTMIECLTISAKYNQVAMETGRDASTVVDPAELEADRATLDRLFADEFRFVDPFGVVGDKRSTIENILSGKIRRDGFGRQGFASTDHAVELYGDVAVSKGTFEMRGSVGIRYIESGAVRRRDLSGVYHTSHTYVRRNGQWQLASSQLTKDPSDIRATDRKRFTHGPPEEDSAPGLAR